ncbi:helicase-related protein [Sphingobium sp.]|uniref:helicase-related protein n=1 Tax=Sphingobium sp. TaxID=1912891 RepID=UPI0039B9CABE
MRSLLTPGGVGRTQRGNVKSARNLSQTPFCTPIHRAARLSSVRDAFNSPFRPFALATTSVGQEGLDFHPYCYRLYHWNLPGNPVDLEQREGRVHRFKGHAIRLNLAHRQVDVVRGREVSAKTFPHFRSG